MLKDKYLTREPGGENMLFFFISLNIFNLWVNPEILRHNNYISFNFWSGIILEIFVGIYFTKDAL